MVICSCRIQSNFGNKKGPNTISGIILPFIFIFYKNIWIPNPKMKTMTFQKNGIRKSNTNSTLAIFRKIMKLYVIRQMTICCFEFTFNIKKNNISREGAMKNRFTLPRNSIQEKKNFEKEDKMSLLHNVFSQSQWSQPQQRNKIGNKKVKILIRNKNKSLRGNFTSCT